MMRQVIMLSGVVLAAGVAAARFADQSKHAPAARPVAAAVASVPAPPAAEPPSSYGSSFVIAPDIRGHFSVQGRIDARPMELMIDTGATVVALREGDAAGLGIHPAPSDFTAEVKGPPMGRCAGRRRSSTWSRSAA